MPVALKKQKVISICCCGTTHDSGECGYDKVTETLRAALENQVEAAQQFRQKKARKKETIRQITDRKKQ